MKQLIITAVILLPLMFITSCNCQEKTEPAQVKHAATSSSYSPFWISQIVPDFQSDKPKRIAEYVRRIFQDSRGNLWFGTNALGVCRYDGDTLVYFSIYNGLSGHQVTGIIEDKRGNIWFSTNGGVSVYDGKLFTSFTEKDGLSSNNVRSIYEDKRGTIWAGTIKGLCRYHREEGARFSEFPLPQADVSGQKPGFSTKLGSSIMEDKSGNLWFGTDGAGVYKYDLSAEKAGAKKFTHITMEDGLCDNSILSIIEDREGNIWFGSRFGGLSRYNPSATTAAGKSFTNFTVNNGDIGNNEVVAVYEDRAGNIWFSSEGYGIYRFKNNQFSHFGKGEGLPAHAVQSIFEDKNGLLWIGSGNGLYIFDGQRFTEFTKDRAGQGC